MTNSKFLGVLLALYALLFLVLAVDPVDRTTWFVENLTVWIVLAGILGFYAYGVRFSKTSYALMFVFIYLHTIGGHWTFANVPFSFVTDLFDFERNHFDRIAHFSVGFYAYPIAELLMKTEVSKYRFILITYPIFLIATVALTYELIEWIYAALAAPEAGIAYLGSQGDIWDAQKDMLADTLGALTAMALFTLKNRKKPNES